MPTDEAYQVVGDMLTECLFCSHQELWVLDFEQGAYQCPVCSYQPEQYCPGPRSIFDIHFDPGGAFTGDCLWCQKRQEKIPVWATVIHWDERQRWAPKGKRDSDYVMAPVRGSFCMACGNTYFGDRGAFGRISAPGIHHHRNRLPKVPATLPFTRAQKEARAAFAGDHRGR